MKKRNSRSTIFTIGRHTKLITGAIIVSSLLASTPVYATEDNATSEISISATNYHDFKADEYWSDDMLWAIDQGLIKGYINELHPITGQFGSWLNPYGDLTEAQMLTVLFQYIAHDELSSIEPTSSFWASRQYQLAEKNDVLTRGIQSSNDTMTRGELAMAIATIHFGHQVSVEAAVQFMYDSGLATGYSDENGNKQKTFASYGATDSVRRAHIATFLKAYDQYIRETAVKSDSNNEASQIETMNAIVLLVNEERQSRGLRPLKIHSGTQLVAEIKAKDMADNDYFDHESPTYGVFSNLLADANIDYDKAGENLAFNYATAKAVVEGWMASKGHRENILNPSYTHIGVGLYENDQNQKYFAQTFIDVR